MIINPTPITASTFNGMWITRLQIAFPKDNQKGVIQGEMLPYDGNHLLATGRKHIHITDLTTKRQSDTELDTMLTTLTSEIQRLSGNNSNIKFVTVNAFDIDRPISAVIIFDSGNPHFIRDCYALAGTDPAFAALFQSVMSNVARLSGLSMQ